MKKIALLFISFLLIFTILPSATADTVPQASNDPTVKIGLYYGSDALPSANLANEIGSGYLFGFFDSDRIFNGVGYTYEEKITVMKDKTYHIDTGTEFPSFDEAALFAINFTSSTGKTAFPSYISGAYRVRIGSYGTLEEANNAAASIGLSGASGAGGSATCYSVTVTSTGSIIFEFDAGPSGYLAIRPAGADYTETWFKGYKYAGSFEYRLNGSNNVTVINVLPLSEYTKGVLPYEMNPQWNQEALKAQAVCAASYLLSNRGKHGSSGFDVCNTTDCQVYRGRNSATANSDAAAEAVKGLALYYDNKVCSTVYHSSNGGSTESAKNVWGTDYPYLQAVPDNFEDLSIANNGIWSFEYTKNEITWILQNKGYSIGNIVDVYVDEYTPAGNVYRLTFVDSSGKLLSFEKGQTRTILNSSTLKKYTHSQRYTISGGILFNVNDASTQMYAAEGYAIGKGGTVSRLSGRTDITLISAGGLSVLKRNTDSFIISGKGWGHNVGMSQYGAKGMAERGYTYEQILRYYFTGAYVQPIR